VHQKTPAFAIVVILEASKMMRVRFEPINNSESAFSALDSLFKSNFMPPFAPSKSSSLKRKANSRFLPVKKARIQQYNIDDLPWKSVSRPSETGLDGDDGILELEEVEGVEVVYEDTSSGRVAKFNVGSPSSHIIQC